MIIDLALAQALPALKAREQKLRALAAAEGIAYEVADFGGLRTQADTTRILKYRDDDYAVYVSKAKSAGKTPVSKEAFRPIAAFGSSFHNYGAAFDAKITGAPAGMTYDAALTRLGALGAKAGLVWGGLWHNADRPHFQLATGLQQVREQWEQFQRGGTPTVTASDATSARAIAAVLPGVQVIAQRAPIVSVSAPHAAPLVRHPLATSAVSLGAIVAASLLAWLVVRRVTE